MVRILSAVGNFSPLQRAPPPMQCKPELFNRAQSGGPWISPLTVTYCRC